MAEGTQQPVTEQQATAKYQASSLLVGSRPNEMGFPLREDEFQILCEGEVSAARASRDLCIGAGVGALVGFVGVLATATVDWETVWKPEHRGWFLFWLAILWLIVSGSAVGACIHQLRLRRARGDSPYSRLTKRMTDWFTMQRPQGKQIFEVSENDLAILSARYGAGSTWIDVGPRLRAKIQDGKLRLRVTNEELGGDPVPTVEKSLEVTYSRGGTAYSKVVPERQELSLP